MKTKSGKGYRVTGKAIHAAKLAGYHVKVAQGSEVEFENHQLHTTLAVTVPDGERPTFEMFLKNRRNS